MHSPITSRIADLAKDHQPVIVTIDGRSGAGKTSLAGELATPDTLLIEVEMLAAGWHDLAGAVRRADRLIAQLRRGPAEVTWWDWHAGTWGETVMLIPRPIIMLVGCGSGQVRADLALWLEAPERVRKARAMARDADSWSDLWADWAAQEERLLGDVDARSHADIVIATGGDDHRISAAE
ncbi:MAG: hypothetical protein Q4P33_03375 [Flaviflexus sp.]|nr:hypothetical protein [Flaviflexus sp.]